jgi:hypothetical protein
MKILHLLNVEKLRDGGSLVLAFQADDSCEYWLMLSIDTSSIENHYQPKLVNRGTGIEIGLSWQDMKSWVNRISQLFSEVTNSVVFIEFEEMVRANT